MLRLIDGSNYYRVQLETDPTGLPARSIITEIQFHPDTFVWVWDGYRNNERRRAIYPLYKANRKPAAEDIYASMDLLQKALKHTKAIQVKVPEYEGDDVIATLAKRYATEEEIGIYSNDFDYMQLTTLPNVFCGAKPKEGIEPKYVRIYKATVGDPSDNIKGITGFGVQTYRQADKDALIELAEGRSYSIEPCALPLKIINWLKDPKNMDSFKAAYKVAGFFTVPMDLIEQHMTVGDSDYAKADAILKEFYQ